MSGIRRVRLRCRALWDARPQIDACLASRPSKTDAECRWKTQDVAVHHNLFSTDPAAIGCGDVARCGQVALFASQGTAPDWSPYLGSGIQDAVTGIFSANAHRGARRSTVHDVATAVDFETWRAIYQQGAGSGPRSESSAATWRWPAPANARYEPQ